MDNVLNDLDIVGVFDPIAFQITPFEGKDIEVHAHEFLLFSDGYMLNYKAVYEYCYGQRTQLMRLSLFHLAFMEEIPKPIGCISSQVH